LGNDLEIPSSTWDLKKAEREGGLLRRGKVVSQIGRNSEPLGKRMAEGGPREVNSSYNNNVLKKSYFYHGKKSSVVR